MPADPPISSAAVLGAGVMGAQIALALSLGGVRTTLWGRRDETLAPAAARVSEALDFLIDAGLADQDQREAVLGRIRTTSDMADAVRDSGFVIEAVTEDVAVKQSVLEAAEAIAAPETILSSTTSALSANEIQSALARPANFVVAHYAQPAHLVKLVEVVPGHQTAPETTETVIALLRATGKTPARCPDIPGFLWARIQHAVLREFASLVGQGLVDAKTCDTILKEGYAVRLPAMGAFEHADLAGLDLMNGEAAKAVWADLSTLSDPADTPVGTLYAQGHTGMRSGKGFYDWTERDPEAFKRQRDAEIVRRLKIQSASDENSH